jgi:rhamnosyltransferase
MTHPIRVAAVVTAYQPDSSLLTALRSASGQVAHVVVVDDGSTSAGKVLEECTALGAVVVRHKANRGIGAALNTGIREVRQTDPTLTHVLTLDQDSELPHGFMDALLAAERDARVAGAHVGMVSPGSVATVGSRRTNGAATFALGGEPIQSGLLLPVTTLDVVGEFDESLVIDGVDTDYWLRSLDSGLEAVVAPGTTLEHRLGHPIVLPGGRSLPLVVASEFRYFYQWRNLVRLLQRHARRHPRWAVGAVARALRHVVLVTVFAPGRARRLHLVAAGLHAGLRDEHGLMPDRP